LGREFRETLRVQKYNEPWAGSSGKHSEFRNIMNHGQGVQVYIKSSEI
jgi:hypothetical protein